MGSRGMTAGYSARAGDISEDGPGMGCTNTSGWCGGRSAIGDKVDNLSVEVALQLICGFPIVPGGQIHTGRCSNVLQSASSLHVLRLQEL